MTWMPGVAGVDVAFFNAFVLIQIGSLKIFHSLPISFNCHLLESWMVMFGCWYVLVHIPELNG